MRKEELRQHAAGMLHNFDTVLDHHDRLEEHEENLRLKSYLDRETKKLKQYNQWKKKREALLESIREKNSTKLGAAKQNFDGANEELQRLGEEIEEKFKEHAQRMEEFKKKRDLENQKRHEKEHLRAEDQQRNIIRHKRQREKEKLMVVMKHMEMEEKMQKLKEAKAHMIEYHRLANEVRLGKHGLNLTSIH